MDNDLAGQELHPSPPLSLSTADSVENAIKAQENQLKIQRLTKAKENAENNVKNRDKEIAGYKEIFKGFEKIKASSDERLDHQLEENANLQKKLEKSEMSLESLKLEHQKAVHSARDVTEKHQKLRELVTDVLQYVPATIAVEFKDRINDLENSQQNLQRESHENNKHVSEMTEPANDLPKEPKLNKLACTYCSQVFPTLPEVLAHKKENHFVDPPNKRLLSKSQKLAMKRVTENEPSLSQMASENVKSLPVGMPASVERALDTLAISTSTPSQDSETPTPSSSKQFLHKTADVKAEEQSAVGEYALDKQDSLNQGASSINEATSTTSANLNALSPEHERQSPCNSSSDNVQVIPHQGNQETASKKSKKRRVEKPKKVSPPTKYLKRSTNMQVQPGNQTEMNSLPCSSTSMPATAGGKGINTTHIKIERSDSHCDTPIGQNSAKSKSYKCSCGDGFNTISVLARHCKRIKFHCESCPRVFHLQNGYRNHMTSQHNNAGNDKEATGSTNSDTIEVIPID